MSTKPTTPRTLDPAIAALRKEHAGKVALLKATQRSAEVLKRILSELLAKLTDADKATLLKELEDDKKSNEHPA